MRLTKMLWFGALVVLLVGPLLWAGMVHGGAVKHWSQARWDSAGLAPDPATTPEAVVQVYAARAWGWKGIFAVHSWIAIKHAGTPAFERYEVVGWGVGRGAPAIRRNMRPIDGFWAGSPPRLVLDRRGPEVEALIGRIETAIANYPYPDQYRTWPGPNSNTFIAHIGREVPALGLDMPALAVGKDYLRDGSLIGRTPSGSGFQLSLLGLLGFSIGRIEGVEVNLFGLTIGVDPLGLALKLPGIGRFGLT
jgi:hypothetical protein